jgi:prolyl 4-hydroxylase
MNHQLSIADPRIDLFSGLVEPSLCQGIMESAGEILVNSTVVSNEDGSSVPNSCRTSRTAYLPEPWSWISRHFSALLGFRPEQAETPQVQCYGLGAEYKPHNDYFYTGVQGGNKQLERGGQRVATAILYLNTVPVGGETEFTELGIAVRPVQGSVLFFRYDKNGVPDSRLLHAGRPVGCGSKWILTQWFRQGVYK